MNRSHHIVPQDKAPEASRPIEERVWAAVQQMPARRPNLDLIGAGILVFFMWPLIFWMVGFVAEMRGGF